ncbi:hypothetical protein RMAECT_1361 [Rickettsia rhipicephali str. Ect]|uniref:Bacteriophage phiJL001 Gp84 C-terminal domain-containing protein n=1 Tax=Rickettsia rhipicephali str. Ect TaxID=1359199 RepID=A0A0F3PKC0_RICRH|nr:hypothetical protein RMAECT_1361 [Rickettsia rhipicephali str. Ect]
MLILRFILGKSPYKFYAYGSNRFNSKVLSNFGDLIILEDIIPDYVKDAEEVKITAGCDKNFITCCAINLIML